MTTNAAFVKPTKEKLAFYNLNKLISFNGIYNFLLGARGLGKTYGLKKHVIRKAIRKGEQFIYLRRYKPELATRDTFFADIVAENEFPDWDFRVNGLNAQMAPASTRDDEKRKWSTIGFFVALSTAQNLKGVSFPIVTTIIYDEFIIEKGNTIYLANEATKMINFLSTVDRNKDKTRVFFLANAVSIDNPYFIEYEIEPTGGDEFIIKDDGFIVCHFADSAEYKAGVYKTRFGRFITGTAYADYAAENTFADNHGDLIAAKVSEAKYQYTIESQKGLFSVWVDFREMNYYIQEKRPKMEYIFTLDPNKMADGKTLVLTSDKNIQMLRTAFRKNRMMFDKPKTRQIFIDVFRRT